MDKLQRQDLFTLEKYAEVRPEFRAKVMAHKKSRKVALGDHATVYFEDRLTLQYQIQEMLRVERIFEAAGIQEELDAYNPLVPDGNNWKATFMVEYDDIDERREMLAKLIGIEDKVWVKVGEHPKVYAIADEDLERETDEKTSSVHFLRFELTQEMCQAVASGASIGVGVDHPECTQAVDPVPENVRAALAADIAPQH
ncbi:DUF3501 family protein [Ectothiorhodospiraceae bacterium 2226]|nr:DUF3501 family protein [Ectothiorhodospiraceae bacterium 2226]